MNKKFGINFSEKPHKTEWIIAAVVFGIFFASYLYYDICRTAPASLNIWDCILKGNIFDFYSCVYEGVPGSYIPNGVYGRSYDLLLYIIFALYNLPLWIVEKIIGTSFLVTYAGRLYMKSILLVFLLLSAWMMKKITLLLTKNENLSSWSAFLFIFSQLTVSSIVLMCGYDILSVFFSLAGLYYYLKADNKRFIFFFAVATTCKMFALWIFIPLLLLREKKILKILGSGVLVVSLSAIPKIIIAVLNKINSLGATAGAAAKVAVTAVTEVASAAAAETTAAAEAAETIKGNGVVAHANLINEKLFCGNKGPISFGNIPLFFVVIFVIWWFAWRKKETAEYETVFICALSMAAFFLFADTYPYWIILLLPYIVLLLILNPKNLVNNVILESISSLGYIIYSACTARHCYNMNLLVYMLKPGRFPVTGDFDYVDYGLDALVSSLADRIGISFDNLNSLFLTCFAVAILLFLYYCRPGQQEGQMDMVSLRKCAWVRAALGLAVALIPMLGIFQYYLVK